MNAREIAMNLEEAWSGHNPHTAALNGRKAVLIELNPEYAKLIEQRTTTTLGLAL